MTRVLIVFFSCDGARERLALACAVGAVQARGSIRLRRLPDADGASQAPANGSVLERMRREYVAPTEDDIAWADALVFCGSAGPGGTWTALLDVLRRLAADGSLDGKVAVVLGESVATSRPGRSSFPELMGSGVLSALGLITVPAGGGSPAGNGGSGDEVSEARTAGRHVVAVARALARGPTTRRDAAALF
jgi:hypothetical protein